MPTATDVGRRHADARLALVDDAEAIALRFWALVDPARIAGSWAVQVPALVAYTSAAQLAAAGTADRYLADVLDAGGIAPQGGPRVRPGAFVGASSGDVLAPQLYRPAITSLLAIGNGAATKAALAMGKHTLSTIVRTQVGDAGRAADQVSLAAHRQLDGYVRVIVGKTCSRCLILAGRRYRWSSGFQRHPRCDCQNLPVRYAEAEDLVQDPEKVYASLTPAQRRAAGWSQVDQDAIAAGADLNQVTNARRGVYTAGGRQFTREGTTRRGIAGQLLGAGRGRRAVRITPDQIFAEANGNRDEAVRLLRRHGYLLDI